MDEPVLQPVLLEHLELLRFFLLLLEVEELEVLQVGLRLRELVELQLEEQQIHQEVPVMRVITLYLVRLLQVVPVVMLADFQMEYQEQEEHLLH